MSWFKSILAPVLSIGGGLIGGPAGAAIGGAIGGAIAGHDQQNQAQQAQDTALGVQTQAANDQLKLANEQWDRYKNVYGDNEQSFVDQAKDWGSEANRTKAAEEAAGDVASSFANLRTRLNSTPGLDPSGTKYLNTLSKIGIDEAAQSAAAQTAARRNVDTTGLNLQKDAVALGKGLPASASASLSGAAGAAALLGRTGQVSQAQGDQTAYNVGRMAGDIASTPGLIPKVGGLFGWGAGNTGVSGNNDFKPAGYGSAPMDDFLKYGTGGD